MTLLLAVNSKNLILNFANIYNERCGLETHYLGLDPFKVQPYCRKSVYSTYGVLLNVLN